MRALIGKEWNPYYWNGDIRETAGEAGDTEPLNSNESSLPVEGASPPVIKKYYRLDALNNRNLFSHSSGSWKAQDEGASFWLEPFS